MLLGLAGTVAPLVPGLPLIWGAALTYGLITEFDAAGWVAMLAISALLVGGMVAKFVLPHRRMTAGGAPRSTLLIGGVGAVIGFFVMPVVGLPLGAVTGILLAEYRRTGDWQRARSSTRAVLVGFGIGSLIEIGAGLAMIGCWVAWVTAGV